MDHNASKIQSFPIQTRTSGGDAQRLVRELLQSIGEDPAREGLRDTPQRFARAFSFFTTGYDESASEIIAGALFQSQASEMVLVRNIEFYSLCEHHLLPFFGQCHVAYIPNGRVVGLSKIPRIVNMFARRLQVQEELTCQIADCLRDAVDARGVAVLMEAQHLCMMMRGVEKQGAATESSCFLGELRDAARRAEFLSRVKA